MTLAPFSRELTIAQAIEADRVARYYEGQGLRDRYEAAGGLASDEERPARYVTSRRAEKAVSVATGLVWNWADLSRPDVGDDLEVRYRADALYRGQWFRGALAYNPDKDHADRRYALVWPDEVAIEGEALRPMRFVLVGWVWGSIAAELIGRRVAKVGGAGFVSPSRLRPFRELPDGRLVL
jgi:hypothetical protein